MKQSLLLHIAKQSPSVWYLMCCAIPWLGRQSLNENVQKNIKTYFKSRTPSIESLFIASYQEYEDNYWVVCPFCSTPSPKVRIETLEPKQNVTCHCKQCNYIFILCTNNEEMIKILTKRQSQSCASPINESDAMKKFNIRHKQLKRMISLQHKRRYHIVHVIAITHFGSKSFVDEPQLFLLGKQNAKEPISYRGFCTHCHKDANTDYPVNSVCDRYKF